MGRQEGAWYEDKVRMEELCEGHVVFKFGEPDFMLAAVEDALIMAKWLEADDAKFVTFAEFPGNHRCGIAILFQRPATGEAIR